MRITAHKKKNLRDDFFSCCSLYCCMCRQGKRNHSEAKKINLHLVCTFLIELQHSSCCYNFCQLFSMLRETLECVVTWICWDWWDWSWCSLSLREYEINFHTWLKPSFKLAEKNRTNDICRFWKPFNRRWIIIILCPNQERSRNSALVPSRLCKKFYLKVKI